MLMARTLLIVFTAITLFTNCTGLKEVNNQLAEIKITEVLSWLNLMPGGPGSFHLSGEFAVYSDSETMIPEMELSEVSVISDEMLLYKFKPVTQYSRTEPDFSTQKKRIEIYQFYTDGGFEIRESLMGNNKIDVELRFIIEGESITRIVRDVEVTRAY